MRQVRLSGLSLNFTPWPQLQPQLFGADVQGKFFAPRSDAFSERDEARSSNQSSHHSTPSVCGFRDTYAYSDLSAYVAAAPPTTAPLEQTPMPDYGFRSRYDFGRSKGWSPASPIPIVPELTPGASPLSSISLGLFEAFEMPPLWPQADFGGPVWSTGDDLLDFGPETQGFF